MVTDSLNVRMCLLKFALFKKKQNVCFPYHWRFQRIGEENLVTDSLNVRMCLLKFALFKINVCFPYIWRFFFRNRMEVLTNYRQNNLFPEKEE